MKRRLLFLAMLVVALTTNVMAQVTKVRGQVVDDETNEPLIGVAVMVQGTSTGTVTDYDGYFTLSVDREKSILIKYVGYKDEVHKITRTGSVNLGVIKLKADAIALADVTITSQVAVARKTPVAVSTIDPVLIEEKLGTQEFPEILKSTPGVYVTKGAGGYGDSKINMRGFQSANVAVMVNGIPMNDMEWGGVYWSNWTVLSSVSRTVQTQRGIGASKVSSPSVGGTMNMITSAADSKRGGQVEYGMGNDGYQRIGFSVSTGLNENGWAVTAMGAKVWGDGYIQGTDFVDYNYFLNITKRIGDSHQISFTGFGAKQEHYQRSNYDGLTIEGWQEVKKYMGDGNEYRYNPTFGYDKNGQRRSSSFNHYHKPQFSINHVWDIDVNTSWSTSLYLSIGDGGGYSGKNTSAYSGAWYGSNNGILNTQFRKDDGTFAYDEIQEVNATSDSGSQMVMTDSKNNHKWYGLLSTFTQKPTDNIEYYVGVDARYYIGTHTNKIVDLYDGDYYVDNYYRSRVDAANNYKANDPTWVNEKLTVGDIVYRDYDSHILQGGVFGQVEYSLDKLNTFLAGSINETSQWRYDRFYYDKAHAESDKVNKTGWTLKGGANYNIDAHHNVFANVGYISRAPFFSGGVFLSSTSSNMVNKDAVNEEIFSLELGYGYKSRFFDAHVNVYHTDWKNKTMARSIDLQDGDRATLNMTGVNATHEGIELDFIAKPTKWLNITGMLSVGDWRWTDDPTGYFYNSAGQPIKNAAGEVASGILAPDHAKMTLRMKDIKVGGSAQTTAALGAKFKVNRDFNLGIDCNFEGRNYADFEVSSNDIIVNGEKTYEQPWRIPSAWTFDGFANYTFKIGDLRSTITGNITNIFNQEYIADAYDGSDHDWKTAYRVYYGFGRTASVKLKVQF